MTQLNSEERNAMLKRRREKQLSWSATQPFKDRNKYTPAGPNKNIKPNNR